jgi:hypothetical protein
MALLFVWLRGAQAQAGREQPVARQIFREWAAGLPVSVMAGVPSGCALVASLSNGTMAAVELGPEPVFRYRVGLVDRCFGDLVPDSASHAPQRLVYIPSRDFLFVVLQRNQNPFLTCAEPRPAGIVDVYQGRSMRRLQRQVLPLGAGEGFEAAADGLFFSAGQGRLVAVDVPTGSVLRQADYRGRLGAMARNPSNNELFLAIEEERAVTVKVLDADTFAIVREWPLSGLGSTSVRDILISPDGTSVHLLLEQPNLWVQTTVFGETLHRLELGKWPNMRLHPSRDPNLLYVLTFPSGLPERYEAVVAIDTVGGRRVASWIIENEPFPFAYRISVDLRDGPEGTLWVSGLTAAREDSAWLVDLDPAELEPRSAFSFGSWLDGGLLEILPFPCPDFRPATCDCDTDGIVTVEEVVRAVRIALDTEPTWRCPMADQNGDDAVTIEEVVRGVNCALRGCT